MTKIKLTYFKKSGKYYTEAEFESQYNSDRLWLITDEVKRMQMEGNLPGLISGGGLRFFVLVEPQEDASVPALIHPYEIEV